MPPSIDSREISCGGVKFLRLENALPSTFSALQREFGRDVFLRSVSSEDAILTANFRDVRPPEGAIYVGRSSCATPGSLFVREGGAWARIPIGELFDPEGSFQVEVAPDFDPIRLVGYILEPLLRIRALLRGHVFVHSSAVVVQGQAVLFPAWGNTGKTNLMLEFAEAGAIPLSDDWAVVFRDGGVAGYPRPINLMNYNLDVFPTLRVGLPRWKRFIYAVDRSFRSFSRSIIPNSPLFLRLVGGIERMLEILANVHLPLEAYDPTENGIYPLGILAPVMKMNDRSGVTWNTVSIEDIVHMATTCFFYENSRILDRIAEYNFAMGNDDTTRLHLWSLYEDNLRRNLSGSASKRIVALSLQIRPTRATLRSLVNDVLLSLREASKTVKLTSLQSSSDQLSSSIQLIID